MLAALDPHSSYMNPKNFKDMQVQTRGEFGGLGIEVTMEEGVVKVVSPIDDTPAAKAGILAGDLIAALDGEAVQGLTLNEAVDKMRGPVNTQITLTIIRKGEDKPFDVKLIRDDIRVHSVRSRVEQRRIAYIRITTFNEQTFDGLKAHRTYQPARRQAEGLRPRPAQQPRRPARPGDRRLRRLPRARRDRLDPRPQCRGDPAPQRACRAT